LDPETLNPKAYHRPLGVGAASGSWSAVRVEDPVNPEQWELQTLNPGP